MVAVTTRLAGLLGALITAIAVHAARPTALDLATPEGGVAAFRKLQCSVEDGKPVVFYWIGETYSRVDGERDRRLFTFEGMNIRQCVTVNDPARGRGFRMVSREVLYYKDPVTGQVLDEWKNPWTGETVKVLHISNDPVNMRTPVFPKDADGKPYASDLRVMGDTWWSTLTVPLFYRNPLGGEYQDYVGGSYHATEMFNFFGSAANLGDPRVAAADAQVAWARLSDWLPWMKMQGRHGVLYFNGAGRKLAGYAELPAGIRATIEARNPTFREPPPLDDPRPNETSWTFFKKSVPPSPGR